MPNRCPYCSAFVKSAEPGELVACRACDNFFYMDGESKNIDNFPENIDHFIAPVTGISAGLVIAGLVVICFIAVCLVSTL